MKNALIFDLGYGVDHVRGRMSIEAHGRNHASLRKRDK